MYTTKDNLINKTDEVFERLPERMIEDEFLNTSKGNLIIAELLETHEPLEVAEILINSDKLLTKLKKWCKNDLEMMVRVINNAKTILNK